VKQVMLADPRQLAGVHAHPDYRASVPTPEHFLPLLYLAGLAAASGETVTTFAEGGTMGAITMTSYLLGGPPQAKRQPGSSEQAPLPDPADVPPEQTNL
jgi:4,5-DOPA dioxygenase extradiol